MARTPKDARVESRAARHRLKPARNPYFRNVAQGLSIGYRRLPDQAGSWIGRRYVEGGKYEFARVGAADDYSETDGVGVLTYIEAVEAIRRWHGECVRGETAGVERPARVQTVADAIEAYLDQYRRRGGKSLANTASAVNAHILPALGSIPLAKLTRSRLEKWLDGVAASAPRRRTKNGMEQQRGDIDLLAPDVMRRRQSTANRIWTILRAALNHALERGMLASDAAWASVKPFREVDAAHIRILTDAEVSRLLNASPADFRALVTAAILTGCRYGELTRLCAADVNAPAQVLHIRKSKSGKPRAIPLNEEGTAFFNTRIAGLGSDDLLFLKANGRAWSKSEQFRPINAAGKAGQVNPAPRFNDLRHFYASRLVMSGASLQVVAAVLGHADTRITEKHYAHLCPDFVAQTVRDLYKPFNLGEATNVVAIR